VPDAPLAAAALPLLTGGVMLLLLSFVSGQATAFNLSDVTTRSVVGLLYLVGMGTVVTFAAYMWLLDHASPTRVATYAFVNPVVAVFIGWAIAGEQISTATIAAAGVIVAAVAVAVSDRPRTPARPAPVESTDPVAPLRSSR